MILLDTDHFSVVTDVRHRLHLRLIHRLEDATEPIAISIVSVEEQLRSWLAQVNRAPDVQKQIIPYDRLIRLIDGLGKWEVARFSESAADEFLRLRKARIRIGTQDLKIASIALANDATLLSANLRDFQQVPDLRVEDWLNGDISE